MHKCPKCGSSIPKCPKCGSDMRETEVTGTSRVYYVCQDCNDPFPKGSIVKERGERGRKATVIGYGYCRDYGPDSTVHWVVVEWHGGGHGQGAHPNTLELANDVDNEKSPPSQASSAPCPYCSCKSPDAVENFALGKRFYVCRICKMELNNA